MISRLTIMLKKMLTTIYVTLSAGLDLGGKLCGEDVSVFKGVIFRKLWHMDYVSRQILQYKQRITIFYYNRGGDIIIPMVFVQGVVLAILIAIYKGKLDEICILEGPFVEKILSISVVQRVIQASALSINTIKIIILLCVFATVIWLLPRGGRGILLGLGGKMVRTVYINMQLGVQVLFYSSGLHIKITRYGQEQELVQFITTTISSYKDYTTQPELQVNIYKLVTQLLNTPLITYDELHIIQHIATYLHTYYPKPIPPTGTEKVTEYLFIQHPLLTVSLITLTMVSVICIVHNRPRPDLEIYHGRRPWDGEGEGPWDTVDGYDVPDGKNLCDYTYEQLEQFRVCRPSRELLITGKIPGEGVRRARLGQYGKGDMFKYHNLRTHTGYLYYEQLQDGGEGRRNDGPQN